MNFDDAKTAALAILREKGHATNSMLLHALDQDRALLAEVRAELIRNDLARDEDGVGLIALSETNAQTTTHGVTVSHVPVERVAVDHTPVGIADAYAVRYLPSQLIAAARWDELIGSDATPGPLTDLRFIQAKCEAGLVHDLMRDYNAAFAALPEFREENERNQWRDAAMLAHNKALREYAKVRADWWFARERGETRPEPPYPQRPSVVHEAAATAIPEDSSPRAARLRHFANFVSAHLAPLEECPGNTLPLAFNQSEVGPVAAHSAVQIAGRKQPWIKRSPRPPACPLRPQCLRTLEGHTRVVESVSMSPGDGRLAVSGSDDKTLRVWDLESGQCLQTLEGHMAAVTSVSVSSDGRRAVSGSANKTLRVWDLESGQCLRTLEGHTRVVLSVSVSSDGRRAVSGSDDKTLRVWDLESGQCLADYYAASAVVLVSFFQQGERMVCGTANGQLHFLMPVNFPSSGLPIVTSALARS